MGKRIIFPATDLVLGYFIRGNEFLLSFRKRTPWLGKLSGLGGNKEPEDKCLIDTLIREVFDESDARICADDIEKRAEFQIFREGKSMILLHVYAMNYSGQCLEESDEMGPHLWFPIKNPPFGMMVPGDKYWFLRFLQGEFLRGKIYRSANAELLLGIPDIYWVDSRELVNY